MHVCCALYPLYSHINTDHLLTSFILLLLVQHEEEISELIRQLEALVDAKVHKQLTD